MRLYQYRVEKGWWETIIIKGERKNLTVNKGERLLLCYVQKKQLFVLLRAGMDLKT